MIAVSATLGGSIITLTEILAAAVALGVAIGAAWNAYADHRAGNLPSFAQEGVSVLVGICFFAAICLLYRSAA